MLTEERISQFYEDVKSLGLKFPVAAISKATKFSKGNVSQYLKPGGNPSQNFLEAFYREFGKSIKKVPNEKTNGDQKDLLPDSPKQPSLIVILENLSESHRNLTAAHKEIAESNNRLAENEKAILSKIPASSKEDRLTLHESVSTILGLREFLEEVAAHVKKVPVKEIKKELDKKVMAAKKRVDSKGIRVDGDSNSTG